MEASVPKNLRWIPKSMQVEYLKKATSNLKAVCKIDTTKLTTGSNPIEVHVFDRKEECVFKATIEMYLSEKRK